MRAQGQETDGRETDQHGAPSPAEGPIDLLLADIAAVQNVKRAPAG
jgi:hypothetical protein